MLIFRNKSKFMYIPCLETKSKAKIFFGMKI